MFWDYKDMMAATDKTDVVYNSLRGLLILNCCQLSLAHGSNDVANSISPLIVIFDLHNVDRNIAYWLGAAGISIGLIFLGKRTLDTVGKRSSSSITCVLSEFNSEVQ